MKKLLVSLPLCILLASCGATKVNTDTLPKDASLKPAPENSQENDAKELEKLRTEIADAIAKQPCTNPAEWRISPIGSKACGGPSGYIAYPIRLEDQILPKIKEYTAQQSTFNKKYKLLSDCSMVMPPTEIRCDGGKAVLSAARASGLR